MLKTNAFISFDYDHDDFLRTAMAGQAKLMIDELEKTSHRAQTISPKC